jgi:hypothetical protein
MELLLVRYPSAGGATVGRLAIDGVFTCYTLEDQVREQRHADGALVEVAIWKIAGETAIPGGTYTVVLDHSTRFGRLMPHLLGVPGFTGVRIHSGNTAADTEGCILVGRRRQDHAITESHLAFDALFPKLVAASNKGERITITIEKAAAVVAGVLA